MYAVTSIAFVNRTLATFLSAEFGFFGVVVYTLTHTPLFWGHDLSAGLFVFRTKLFLPCFTNCAIVGTIPPKIKMKRFPSLWEKTLRLYQRKFVLSSCLLVQRDFRKKSSTHSCAWGKILYHENTFCVYLFQGFKERSDSFLLEPLGTL